MQRCSVSIPTTGVVTLSAAQSFASPADANADGVYEITVRATDADGQFDQLNVQLTLTAVPVAPATPATIVQPQAPGTGTGTAPSKPGRGVSDRALNRPALPPLGPQFADPTLGLPVDGGVAPANLAGTPAPAAPSAAPAGVPSPFDLNALAPTAAGEPPTLPSHAFAGAGYCVPARGSAADRGTGRAPLVRLPRRPDMRLLADGPTMLRVPTDAFAHTDSSALVQLEARLANGSPRPAGCGSTACAGCSAVRRRGGPRRPLRSRSSRGIAKGVKRVPSSPWRSTPCAWGPAPPGLPSAWMSTRKRRKKLAGRPGRPSPLPPG